MCTQGECVWLHLDLIAGVTAECRKLFGAVRYAYCTIPTYPSGQIGFIISSADEQTVLAEPSRAVDAAMQASLRYYNSDVHRAAFVLPGELDHRLSSRCRYRRRLGDYKLYWHQSDSRDD